MPEQSYNRAVEAEQQARQEGDSTELPLIRGRFRQPDALSLSEPIEDRVFADLNDDPEAEPIEPQRKAKKQ